MKLFAPATSVGVTLKFVLNLDGPAAEKFLHCLPGSIRISGLGLDSDELKIGVDGEEVEPARVWVQLDELPGDREDEYLERIA
jgi:hypothetical protein